MGSKKNKLCASLCPDMCHTIDMKGKLIACLYKENKDFNKEQNVNQKRI